MEWCIFAIALKFCVFVQYNLEQQIQVYCILNGNRCEWSCRTFETERKKGKGELTAICI